jgi:hypothetical protein
VTNLQKKLNQDKLSVEATDLFDDMSLICDEMGGGVLFSA